MAKVAKNRSVNRNLFLFSKMTFDFRVIACLLPKLQTKVTVYFDLYSGENLFLSLSDSKVVILNLLLVSLVIHSFFDSSPNLILGDFAVFSYFRL